MKNQTRLHITLHIYTADFPLLVSRSIHNHISQGIFPFLFLFLLPWFLLLLCFLFIEKEGHRQVCVFCIGKSLWIIFLSHPFNSVETSRTHALRGQNNSAHCLEL